MCGVLSPLWYCFTSKLPFPTGLPTLRCSVTAGQQAAGTAALTRLFSACTSLCHFWAGLDSKELELCFGEQPTSQASVAAAGASTAATTAARMATRVIQAALQLLWPALLETKPVERGCEAGRQWDRWV